MDSIEITRSIDWGMDPVARPTTGWIGLVLILEVEVDQSIGRARPNLCASLRAWLNATTTVDFGVVLDACLLDRPIAVAHARLCDGPLDRPVDWRL